MACKAQNKVLCNLKSDLMLADQKRRFFFTLFLSQVVLSLSQAPLAASFHLRRVQSEKISSVLLFLHTSSQFLCLRLSVSSRLIWWPRMIAPTAIASLQVLLVWNELMSISVSSPDHAFCLLQRKARSKLTDTPCIYSLPLSPQIVAT